MAWEVTCPEKSAAEVKRKLTSETDGLKLFEILAELAAELDLEESDTASSTDSNSSKSEAPPPPREEPEERDELMPPATVSSSSVPPPGVHDYF